MKYLVKSHFNGWVEVTEEKFYGFRRLLRNTTSNIPADKKDEYIESRTKIVDEESHLKYTIQEVVDMGADMYDNKGCSRAVIKQWLMDLLDRGYASFDLDRIFDLIIG